MTSAEYLANLEPSCRVSCFVRTPEKLAEVVDALDPFDDTVPCWLRFPTDPAQQHAIRTLINTCMYLSPHGREITEVHAQAVFIIADAMCQVWLNVPSSFRARPAKLR